MSGPKIRDREQLGKLLKRHTFWAEVFGWAVGGALVIEYWDSIIDCVAYHRWPSLSLVGGILVVACVWAEVLFSRFVSTTSDDIQHLADSDVARALARAAEADLKRAELEERLSARHVSDKQAESLGERLAPLADKVAIRVLVIDDDEAIRFARELKPAFDRSGVFIEERRFSPNGAPVGLAIFALPEDKEYALIFEKAIYELGISKTRLPSPTDVSLRCE